MIAASAWPAVGQPAASWSYLVDKLAVDGIDRSQALAAFVDPRVGTFTGIDVSLHRGGGERRSLYRHFLRARTIAAVRRCRAEYADELQRAERIYAVPADILAAIFYVESGCGHHTGSHVILIPLARLAMANAPENLARNLTRFADRDGSIDPAIAAQVRARALELEQTFYPQVRALFAVAERMGVDPLEITGSPGGAFGYPQFLPTSYLEDGVDADGDGRVDLYNPADAIASCARYFVHHGWRPGLSAAERRAVVWAYNHSQPYVDTVLTLAARMRGPMIIPAVARVKSRPAHHGKRLRRRHRLTRSA